MMKSAFVYRAVVTTAFILVTGVALGQTVLPVKVDCQTDNQSVSLTLVSERQRTVALTMSSVKGNVMHTTVRGSGRSRMVLDKAQFPVIIQMETTGDSTRLSISEDCQITPQYPSS